FSKFDSIYSAGVEAAPSFKKLRKEYYSFKGVPPNSVVRKYPNRLIERLYTKPFWIWDVNEHKSEDITTHGECCFNHIIGLPKKDGIEKPMFDYEKVLYDFLLLLNENDFKDKHLWVKKATGLGVTEFFLRLIVWLSLKDESLSGSQVCIITGPNLQLAIGLIRRLKAL